MMLEGANILITVHLHWHAYFAEGWPNTNTKLIFFLHKYKYNVVYLHGQPNFAEFVDQAEDVLADGEGVL